MESVPQSSPEVAESLLSLMLECDGLREFGARVLQAALNMLMSAEADSACGAPLGERSGARVNSRNGYRSRSLKMAARDLELEIPKLRRGPTTPSRSWRGGPGSRRPSPAALVVEAYVNGVSTRDMSLLANEPGVGGVSSSDISRLARELDAQVGELRSRDLGPQHYCYLWVDATCVRCRVAGRSVSQALVTAIALGEDGYKHLIGLDCVDAESHSDWKAFLASIRARGLEGPVLVVSDAYAGLTRAISEVFQGAAWQRRTVHL